jgi:hypothetical protein
MTDRELLELAAKAIGLPECGWMGPAFMYVKDNTFTDWNPLTDDGDALRLAVKLKLCFGPNFEGDLAVCFGNDGRNITEAYEADPYAATRRAITRAAAEIGKTLDK